MNRARDLPQVKILLFDHASLPTETRKHAQGLVVAIFYKAGVDLQ
jgi:hypothetical protein